jgi:tetratricopeptide (TPR) repeat protein
MGKESLHTPNEANTDSPPKKKLLTHDLRETIWVSSITPAEISFFKELCKDNLVEIPKPKEGKKEPTEIAQLYKSATIFLANDISSASSEGRENAEELVLTLNEYKRFLSGKDEKKYQTKSKKISKLKSKKLTPKQEEEATVFLEKHSLYSTVERKITDSTKSDTTIFVETILDYGIEQLMSQIKDPTKQDGSKLTDNPELRKEISILEDLRKNKSNKKKISIQERNTAYRIQKLVSKFEYESVTATPSKILETDRNSINCVGASVIGGALMEMAGLNYLVVDLPTHSALILITSDRQVEWRDMLIIKNNFSLKNENITNTNIDNIIKFYENPSEERLTFVHHNAYNKDYRRRVTAYKPKIGHYVQILLNLGYTLSELEKHEEALEAEIKAADLDPENVDIQSNLGLTLYKLGKHEDAIKVLEKAADLDPEHVDTQSNLGATLYKLGKHEEALEAVEKALELDPENAYIQSNLGLTLYKLGRYEDALEAVEKALELDPENAMYKSLIADMKAEQSLQHDSPEEG